MRNRERKEGERKHGRKGEREGESERKEGGREKVRERRERGEGGRRGREGRRRNIIITCLPSYSPLTPKGSL